MNQYTVKTFSYNELSEAAKEKAREWYRNFDVDFFDDFILEDYKEIAKAFGLYIDNIYYSGFYSQGDGASFTGSYRYNKGALKKIKADYPAFLELHAIVERLQYIQAANFFSIRADISQSGHYYHENTIRISAYDYENENRSLGHYENDLLEVFKDYARLIYSGLYDEYKHMQSDEYIEETIIANDYEFISDGFLFNSRMAA